MPNAKYVGVLQLHFVLALDSLLCTYTKFKAMLEVSFVLRVEVYQKDQT